jgi:hypothetical protein
MYRDMGAAEYHRSQEIGDADPHQGSLSPCMNGQEPLQASAEQELFDNRLPDHGQEEGQGQNAMPWQRLDGYKEWKDPPEGRAYGETGEKNRSTIKARHLLEPKELTQYRHIIDVTVFTSR